jgi:two-component system, NtrC family, nitrogen regulation sensor histidine kinase NtrY
MRKRIIYGGGAGLLAILVTLVVCLASISSADFTPASSAQTYALLAVSTVIFLLTVALAFMLVKNFVKLYVERHRSREGSRIRTKFVLGALALSATPVVFQFIFSYVVLSHNLNKWFSSPADVITRNYITLGRAIEQQNFDKARALAGWLATLPEVQDGAATPAIAQICTDRGIAELVLMKPDGARTLLCGGGNVKSRGKPTVAEAQTAAGKLLVYLPLPMDLARTSSDIEAAVARYNDLVESRKETRFAYLELLILITLFVLFFAVWIALFYAKLIIVPISALLGAAQQVRGGNLGYRVRVSAIDELDSLVRAFNEMTQDLETNSRELENRRRFTEAILESIPTGVVSLSSDGRIQKVNRALKAMLGADRVERAARLDDLLPPEDAREIRYLMNRARRTGIAGTQLELKNEHRFVHLSVTVASLEDKVTSGYVLVVEDTSDLLRAQKAAAWHEVARRIAHEIKNPLTPIALCAERIGRHLARGITPDTPRVMQECSATIASEVESLKTLVDEFAQFARFPAAQPVPSDLNEIVEGALAVFNGRLDGIEIHKDLALNLPPVNVDREQFKRVVVNLVDNAAEAMQNSHVRGLSILTAAHSPEVVELVVADTGCGVSPEDKEKLFLPYFSTKGRGTGLGLAIVNHILADHNAHIRVEDNLPSGARFVVELATLTPSDPEVHPAELHA